jgi:hypothetical protein
MALFLPGKQTLLKYGYSGKRYPFAVRQKPTDFLYLPLTASKAVLNTT